MFSACPGVFRAGSPNADFASPALAEPPVEGQPASLDGILDIEFAGFESDRPRLVTRRAPGERFFACGERTAGLEKTGSHQVFWNIDPPMGHTASFNNLYTSIPFVLSLRGGRAYGRAVRQHGSRGDRPRQGGSVARGLRGGGRRPALLRVRRPDAARRARSLHRADGANADAAAVGARQPAVALELHERGRGALAGRGVPRARHPVRRALPRHRLHGGLPGLHVGRGAVPGSRGVHLVAGCGWLPGRDDHRSGREGGPGLSRLSRGARERLLLPDVRGRGVPQRRLARAVRVPGLLQPDARASGGDRCTRGSWMPASRACGAT